MSPIRASRWRRGVASLLLLSLAQCSELGAFEGPQPNEATHSLCYTRAAASPEQLRTLATQVCAGGTPRFIDQITDISACPLLIPMRVAFVCEA